MKELLVVHCISASSKWNLIISPNIRMTDFQIETGSKVELPFWLAHELQLRQAVSVSVPPCFNQK